MRSTKRDWRFYRLVWFVAKRALWQSISSDWQSQLGSLVVLGALALTGYGLADLAGALAASAVGAVVLLLASAMGAPPLLWKRRGDRIQRLRRRIAAAAEQEGGAARIASGLARRVLNYGKDLSRLHSMKKYGPAKEQMALAIENMSAALAELMDFLLESPPEVTSRYEPVCEELRSSLAEGGGASYRFVKLKHSGVLDRLRGVAESDS